MLVLLCCGRRTLIARKAMRRRINENAEMSGANYYKEQAAKDFALRTSDSREGPQYPEFKVTKPVSPDRLPLNPSSQNLIAENKSGETMSTQSTLPGNHNTAGVAATSNPPRVGLPSGPSPYGGVGYPPAVQMPRPPYPDSPPGSKGNERGYVAGQLPPPSPPRTIPGVLPDSRSNASLNSMNRRPPSRQNHDNQYPVPPPPVAAERQASSVYSDYVPPRQQWGSVPTESRSLQDTPLEPVDRGYRPERPKIDTSNLENRNLPVYPQRFVSPVEGNRRRSETGGSAVASYYEDVDPRFDDNREEEMESANAYRPVAPLTTSNSRRRSNLLDQDRYSPVERDYSHNLLGADFEEGPRSPAASISSHFTSVSQRGINPRWQPGPQQDNGGGGYGDGHARRNRAPRNDQMNFLSGNPDFELPVSRSGRRNGPGGIGGTGIDMGSRYPVPR